MTEPQQWQTHEPPWLAGLHPDIVEAPADQGEREPTTEERAARLVEQLERAASGRVPPALAGEGWHETDVAEYDAEPPAPVIRARVPGPYPCQLAQPIVCPVCDRKCGSTAQLAVHQAARHPPRVTAPARAKPAGGVTTKPKPGARTKKAKRRR